MISVENSNRMRIESNSAEEKKSPKNSNAADSNGTQSDLIGNLNGIYTKQSMSINQRNNSNNLSQNSSKIEYTTVNNFHSPKVFTSNSVTVNAPAKDVLGPKFTNFTKNLTQIFTRSAEKQQSSHESPSLRNKDKSKLNSTPVEMPAETTAILTKVNNATANNGHITNGNGNGSDDVVVPIAKLQPVSACYDRYPKPGSYGNLQLFPMNGLNSVINKGNLSPKSPQNGIYGDCTPEEEMSKVEQDRLEELLKLFDDYERQNQSVQSSPIVQNRIKTNGSLPREKKSPMSPDHINTNADVFFPSNSKFDARQSNQSQSKPLSPQAESPAAVAARNGGYDHFMPNHSTDLTPTSPSSRYYENSSIQSKPVAASSPYVNNGYENVANVRRSPVGNVPQSPRTRIKTFISPKKELPSTPIQRKTDYELLVQSFEEKLRMEAQQLRDLSQFNSIPHAQSNRSRCEPDQQQQYEQNSMSSSTASQPSQRNHAQPTHCYVNVNVNRPPDSQKNHQNIYGTLTTAKNKNINNLTVTIKKNLDEQQIVQLRRQHVDVLKKTRELKAQISELQRQEEEVLRELDLEKALVTAELTTEQSYLVDMEKNMAALQTKIHRLEAQRNANRVLQETQQNKLKQAIEMRQSQIDGLKKMMAENESDDGLKDELNEMMELLENDTKTFEDLEFQYLEEETEWLAYREELYNEQKILSRRMSEKRKHIQNLEAQGIDNQKTACADTKNIEKDIWSMVNQLEKYREELKTVETLLFELSGENNGPSDSDDDFAASNNRAQSNIMSQSLFGSQEILSTKHSQANDLMSKSVNENLFSNKIEMLSFAESKDMGLDGNYQNVPKAKRSDNRATPNEQTPNEDDAKSTDGEADPNDPLQKLKYNLSPPFDHKVPVIEANDSNKSANLNLSIESDDFEVNPLEKRVPSQDDIDRICKVTTDAPISTDGASYKVIESIKEIERNRQLLLAQQGSHVIEHERQKMSELKKKSHDEARAQYMQLQSHTDTKYRNKSGSLEHLETKKGGRYDDLSKRQQTLPVANSTPNKESEVQRNLRHSHPEVERERPLSEANSEISYDALSDKQYKSFSDIRLSSGRMNAIDHDMSGGSQRGSIMSSENSESGRMVSGAKRNLPKHQRPLTRYLPIMSADLDLRLHIESAGHQVNLCPHVIVDSVSCRGYLHKLGATFHGWSKRWFVLDRQKMALIYYSDKSERKPRGGAYFSTIDEVYLDHLNTSKSGRPHCTFIVKTKRRSYHLQAASDSAARIWIDAIITGAQGNIDY